MDLYMLVCGWYALGGYVLGILKHLSCFVAKKFCDSSLMFCVVFSERVAVGCFLELPVYFGDAFSWKVWKFVLESMLMCKFVVSGSLYILHKVGVEIERACAT